MNRNNYFGNMANLVDDSGSSAMFSSEMQGLSGLVHDVSTDNIESSSSFVIAATPDNGLHRSGSVSFEAPRAERRQHRIRSDDGGDGASANLNLFDNDSAVN